MGIFVNPGNESFCADSGSDVYIDKTMLLDLLNSRIGRERRYVSVSRPRRFGKSVAAGMLCAYYSRGCRSKELFSPYAIAGTMGFEEHLNQYHVLHVDVSSFWAKEKTVSSALEKMNEALVKDFREEFPYLKDLQDGELAAAADAIIRVYNEEKVRFVIIIDEWDCLIREAGTDAKAVAAYLKYLRTLFKTEESKRFLALGYITGILPIKKIDGESAMNNFSEFTILDPAMTAAFFGFTEEEVEKACGRYRFPMEKVRALYDGYLLKWTGWNSEGYPASKLLHMYNPNSLSEAFSRGELGKYWRNTGAFRVLNNYIERNEEGLRDAIIRMLAGEEFPVNTETFQNDLVSFKTKDDVLTALIHMGYLGYNPENGTARIPNEEVRAVFESAIRVGGWTQVREALEQSDELLEATLRGDEKKVAQMIERSHQDYASIIAYHDENALACAIMMSFYTAREKYIVVRELPSGRGFADVAFLPKPDTQLPPVIVELKWNRSARAALRQIRDRNYTGRLRDYKGEIVLVGINYSRKTGKHTCRIEKLRR